MRLHRLTLTAFGPFAGTQQVDFDALSAAGLFLLHGPTGAGKTSVLDAVCFALYGSVPGARQHSAPSLRSHHADPFTATEVLLDLTLAGRRLEITRRPEQSRPKKRGTGTTRDKPVSLLREHDPATGAWRPLSRSHQEIGEELGQLLGMNREQFCQVVLLPQGDFARFLRAAADDRRTLLGRLFGSRRFAAAEQRLGELRSAALRRVRAGDERLLATAHRIGQAAGHHPDLAARPLPDLAPGDPDLADTVLEWAAVARAAARERQDITTLALHTAEHSHHHAQQQLADTIERARLQQRYAEARRRAAELSDQREERAHTRAVLERARAADTVAPALSLRDAAETEHRDALTSARSARATLPPALADAPAACLATREREARERLGALAAARGAEDRAARLTADLAALDREAAADDALLAEVDEVLAEGDATRERLTARLDRALAAQARAEQTAAELETARHRLTAARRRDDLAGQLREAQEDLPRAREGAADAHDHWLDLKERRLRGIAAELAAALRPDHPCDVCGSRDHPRPAQPGAGHVDRVAEDAARAAHQDAETRREQAQQRLAVVREAHIAASAAAGDRTTAELTTAVEVLAAARTEARQAADDIEQARATLFAAEQQLAAARTARQEADRRAAARRPRRASLLAERAVLREEIARARGGAASVADRAAELQREADTLAAAAEAARRVAETADRLKEADARLSDAAFHAGFATPQAAADALLDEEQQRALQRRLDAWRAEEAAVAALRAEAAAGERAGEGTGTGLTREPAADPDAARAAVDTATRRLRDAAAAAAAARARCTDLDALSHQATAAARRLAPLRAECRRVTRLADLAVGTSSDNAYRMRLETYVLAARLEQVAAAATVRLHRMSAGRYTLLHSDTRATGRGRSGLGLHVLDAWTGRARDTASLSGGESFVVSLALALGLADVVTGEAGGQRLDTLFIDEGFGSLDEQALEEVLDVLDALREQDRSVGIVSHVPDLRARIPAQLEVVKTRRGSTLRPHTAPTAL